MKFIAEKKIFFFLSFLLILSYARSPDIFSQGRFWAEDGSLYFQNALKNLHNKHNMAIMKCTTHPNLPTTHLKSTTLAWNIKKSCQFRSVGSRHFRNAGIPF